MSVKLLTEHHLEFLSLKGGCTGWSESTLVKMPHCWKSLVTAHLFVFISDIVSKFRLLKSKQVISALAHNLEKVIKTPFFALIFFVLDMGKQVLWQAVKTQMKCCLNWHMYCSFSLLIKQGLHSLEKYLNIHDS